MQATDLINNTSLYIDQASPYEFGVISSLMHNAWLRVTCGRLKSDLRYSASIVYNNFPWPELPEADDPKRAAKLRAAIEKAAQAVLDARAQYPGESLAALYDPLTMPVPLLKAHQALDKAVDAAYGKSGFKSEAERVAFLFDRYLQYLQRQPAARPARRKKTTDEVCA